MLACPWNAQHQERFNWKFHLKNGVLALLPSVCVLGLVWYSRRKQQSMSSDLHNQRHQAEQHNLASAPSSTPQISSAEVCAVALMCL